MIVELKPTAKMACDDDGRLKIAAAAADNSTIKICNFRNMPSMNECKLNRKQGRR